jgi:hypothetical protein
MCQAPTTVKATSRRPACVRIAGIHDCDDFEGG